jgi:hypothetical protein
LTLFALTVAAVLGCGGSETEKGVNFQGKVTLDGEPLPAGMVVFEVNGYPEPKTVAITADGTYQAVGVPFGMAKVAVRTSHMQGAAAASAKYAKKVGKAADKPDFVMVPKKYESTATSGLEYQTEDGKEINIELKK